MRSRANLLTRGIVLDGADGPAIGAIGSRPLAVSTSKGRVVSASSARDSRTTTWMVITGLLALVVIGLAIWAFTTKSDLDDANASIDNANATIAKKKREQANEAQTAQQEEARLRAIGRRERAAFRRVKRRFIREQAAEGRLKATITQEASQVEQARSETAAAQSQDQKDKAALKQAREESQLAAACVQGTVTAIDRFFNATTAREGANAAVAELQSIQDQCNKANQ